LDVELPDREIHQRLQARRVARFLLNFRLRYVRVAIGKHDDVHFRLLNAEILQIDGLLQSREQLQSQLEQRHTDQRVCRLRLGPVQHEIADSRSQMRPFKLERPDLNLAARRLFRFRDNLLPNVIGKPCAAQHQNGRNHEHQNQPNDRCRNRQQDLFLPLTHLRLASRY
jgi:hypothetical protein